MESDIENDNYAFFEWLTFHRLESKSNFDLIYIQRDMSIFLELYIRQIHIDSYILECKHHPELDHSHYCMRIHLGQYNFLYHMVDHKSAYKIYPIYPNCIHYYKCTYHPSSSHFRILNMVYDSKNFIKSFKNNINNNNQFNLPAGHVLTQKCAKFFT